MTTHRQKSNSPKLRRSARPKPDAFVKLCPSRAVLERVSGKWTPLAIVALAEVETLGFGALRRRLEGVSQKMLTQTLRSLERDGLVSRKETDGAPVRRVQYALTARGRALQPLLAALKVWVETHLKEIEKTNAVFDARA